jgi:hypothetical protein
MPAHFLATLPNFLAYLGAAAVLLAAFVAIYLFVTPYDEIKLIRENNLAAAVSLSGAVLGFAMPIANVIAHSDTLLDLAVWQGDAHGPDGLHQETVYRHPAMDRGGRRHAGLAFPDAGNGNPERRQPDGARFADGDVRQRRHGGRRFRAPACTS